MSGPTAMPRTLPMGFYARAIVTPPSYPTLLTPDEPYEFRIDLWATSHVFLPGHSLRVEVSSSNFPRFDRNLNTGGDQATGTQFQTAQQTVLHNKKFQSHIVLPVIPS